LALDVEIDDRVSLGRGESQQANEVLALRREVQSLTFVPQIAVLGVFQQSPLVGPRIHHLDLAGG